MQKIRSVFFVLLGLCATSGSFVGFTGKLYAKDQGEATEKSTAVKKDINAAPVTVGTSLSDVKLLMETHESMGKLSPEAEALFAQVMKNHIKKQELENKAAEKIQNKKGKSFFGKMYDSATNMLTDGCSLAVKYAVAAVLLYALARGLAYSGVVQPVLKEGLSAATDLAKQIGSGVGQGFRESVGDLPVTVGGVSHAVTKAALDNAGSALGGVFTGAGEFAMNIPCATTGYFCGVAAR